MRPLQVSKSPIPASDSRLYSGWITSSSHLTNSSRIHSYRVFPPEREAPRVFEDQHRERVDQVLPEIDQQLRTAIRWESSSTDVREPGSGNGVHFPSSHVHP